MDKFDRVQQLHRIFKSRLRPIPISKLAERMECSEKTARRTIDIMRDHLYAPIEYFKEQNGWQYNLADGDLYELPGLWLTASEITALSSIIHLTKDQSASIVSSELDVFAKTVDKLPESRGIDSSVFKEKVLFLAKHKHFSEGYLLEKISDGLINENRINIAYCDYVGRKTTREVSPLKLVHYDDNWYLDAWCHLRDDLRSFMLARIEDVKPLTKKIKTVSAQSQAEHFASSYGIFSGKAKHTAKLKFNGIISREAASYQWHPDQQSRWEDAYYFLEFPYSDDRELVRTLLGYGDGVEVLAPSKLKQRVLTKAKQIVSTYESNWRVGRF